MNVQAFLEAATPAAMGSSILLGLMVGAFYGWHVIGQDHPPVYPVALWAVGLAFIVMIAVLSATDAAAPNPYALEFGIARTVLWTATCGAIPIGRWVRHLLAIRLLRRKRQRLEADNGHHG